MMDDDTAWQKAALNANDLPLIGPVQPAAGGNDAAPDYDAAGPIEDEYDDLESGIASIFAALQAANEEDEAAPEAIDEADKSRVDAHTFQLLSELDRLWQRSGA
jgi:hypothetical protein